MLLHGYLIVFILMSLFWLIYLKTKLPNVVDLGWVIGIFVVSLYYSIMQPLTNEMLVIGILLCAWAIRLGGFLWWTRLRKGERDKRYDAISAHWKMPKALGFFVNYQFQGVLVILIALPFYFISNVAAVPLWQFTMSIILIAISIVGEAIADYQLFYFKTAKLGLVCDKGLWRYSRHPNYFFEWLTWLGFSLLVVIDGFSLLALISPLLLYVIMNFITGPITEREQAKHKGEAFISYQRKTNAFFLGVPKND